MAHQVFNILAQIAIVIEGVTLAFLDLLWWFKHNDDQWRFIKGGYALSGLFIAVVYLLKIITSPLSEIGFSPWIRIGLIGFMGMHIVGATLRLRLGR